MRRSTLTGAVLAALLAASYLGTTGAVKAAGYVETDLIIGGPHVTTTTPQTLTDSNGIVHPLNNPKVLVDPNLVNAWGLSSSPAGSIWDRDGH
jgi:hypothetical protein